jgi:hypothetical protein
LIKFCYHNLHDFKIIIIIMFIFVPFPRKAHIKSTNFLTWLKTRTRKQDLEVPNDTTIDGTDIPTPIQNLNAIGPVVMAHEFRKHVHTDKQLKSVEPPCLTTWREKDILLSDFLSVKTVFMLHVMFSVFLFVSIILTSLKRPLSVKTEICQFFKVFIQRYTVPQKVSCRNLFKELVVSVWNMVMNVIFLYESLKK